MTTKMCPRDTRDFGVAMGVDELAIHNLDNTVGRIGANELFTT